MSLERAKISCERCYDLIKFIRHRSTIEHKSAKSDHPSYSERVSKLCEGSKNIYDLRIDAMKALEEEEQACREAVHYLGVNLEQTNSALATESLRACAECDYKEPLISKIVSKGEKVEE